VGTPTCASGKFTPVYPERRAFYHQCRASLNLIRLLTDHMADIPRMLPGMEKRERNNTLDTNQ